MKPQLEVVPHELNSSIHAFHYQKEYFDAPWHYHLEFELVYILESSGIRYVGNSIENFQPGDLVLIGSALPHVWKNAPEYNSGSASMYIQWKPEALTEVFQSIVEFHGINSLLERSKNGVRFTNSKKNELVASKMKNLLEQKGARKILAFADILYELSEIKEFDILSGAGGEFIVNKGADHRIKDIFTFIDQNYTQPISIDDMAELTYMTNVSFCKFFKKQFKKTFTQFLNEFRIRKTCQLLQESHMGVTQIALECGYDNMSFFHRQFKKYVGLTPAKYRDKYRGLVKEV